ncbi:MAG: hypothetical protein ACI4JM_00315, partial [Oscillospiraceae bacterium]
AFAQTFFGKSLTKNFFERIEGRGLCPHTPVSLIRATKGFAFGNHQLFEKSWAKTFSFGFCFMVHFFTYPTALKPETATCR